MSDRGDPAEVAAQEMIESLGLVVHRVPTGTGKTAEFLVDGDGRGYVIEVKTRGNRGGWKREVGRGDAAMESRAVGWSTWAEDAPHDAVKQMKATDPDHGRWWVLWVSIDVEPAGGVAIEEVAGSLYGGCPIAYWDDGGGLKQRNCLYVVPGVFERHPELCGCVIVAGDQSWLAVNEFAGDRDGFQASRLCGAFAERGSIVTEATMMARGVMAILDRECIDRRSDDAIAAYLEKAYRLKRVFVLKDMKEHSATMRVPPGDEGGENGRT